eukprot:313635_1
MEFVLAAMVGILQLLAKLMDQVVDYYLYFTEAEEWSTIAGISGGEGPDRDEIYQSAGNAETILSVIENTDTIPPVIANTVTIPTVIENTDINHKLLNNNNIKNKDKKSEKNIKRYPCTHRTLIWQMDSQILKTKIKKTKKIKRVKTSPINKGNKSNKHTKKGKRNQKISNTNNITPKETTSTKVITIKHITPLTKSIPTKQEIVYHHPPTYKKEITKVSNAIKSIQSLTENKETSEYIPYCNYNLTIILAHNENNTNIEHNKKKKKKHHSHNSIFPAKIYIKQILKKEKHNSVSNKHKLKPEKGNSNITNINTPKKQKKKKKP